MGLRVAIDLDGTVADLSRAMHGVATRYFGAPRTAPSPPAAAPPTPSDRPALQDLALRPSEIDALWTEVLRTKNFWTTLDETESGIVARIAALAADRRWDVLFITTRPTATGETTQVQSQKWLHAHGFPHPSVYVVKGSRGKVASALDLGAVVDDRPENCLDVATESAAKAVLVWPGALETLGPGVTKHGVVVTRSIGAALDELVEMDRARRGGVVQSLKRLLRRQ
ncbi:MAG TPA: hypothetical protein VMW48_07890 [Vicinamibacterales bacterium]|nr:hypothetical protein [Vicinamibacterales bacterium]